MKYFVQVLQLLLLALISSEAAGFSNFFGGGNRRLNNCYYSSRSPNVCVVPSDVKQCEDTQFTNCRYSVDVVLDFYNDYRLVGSSASRDNNQESNFNVILFGNRLVGSSTANRNANNCRRLCERNIRQEFVIHPNCGTANSRRTRTRCVQCRYGNGGCATSGYFR